jgi:hydroxymethylbilane synthase
VAVHSLKDLPTESAPGLTLAAVPDRAPVHDVLILPDGAGSGTTDGEELVRSLPSNARIGTGSPRRQAQLLHFRDDLQMLDIRGNVETRLRKLDDGEYDAIVLAEAGLRRLGLADRISAVLRPPLMLHAVGQGALGIECRDGDDFTRDCLAAISNPEVHAAASAERSLLRELRAGCHAPVGVTSRVSDSGVYLEGVVLSPDGTERFSSEIERPREDAESAGALLAQVLIAQGASQFLV